MGLSEQPTRHLYLARHGQTALNAEGRLRGLADPPLDATGIAEAQSLAAELAPKNPSIVISSPLQRAARTAQILADTAGAPQVTDDRFNDRDYGPQTGQVKDEVIASWGSVDRAPGVEPVADVLARARPALDAVLDAHPGTVVVVTHDAVIRPLLKAIDPTKTDLTVPTGSWNHLVRTGTAWQVHETDQRAERVVD
jgi:probable phosphoglycerate mutase